MEKAKMVRNSIVLYTVQTKRGTFQFVSQNEAWDFCHVYNARYAPRSPVKPDWPTVIYKDANAALAAIV